MESATGEARERQFGGDDYAMMREVFSRRFGRALKEDPDRSRGQWPDLVLIDGGQGQLTSAQEVFAELGIGDLAIVGDRQGAGPQCRARAVLFAGPTAVLARAARSRCCISCNGCATRRTASRSARIAPSAPRRSASSPLDEIPGIGAKRKQALLHHFGSARAVARAGLAEIERVAGISKTVAKKVYDHFHDDG